MTRNEARTPIGVQVEFKVEAWGGLTLDSLRLFVQRAAELPGDYPIVNPVDDSIVYGIACRGE